MNSFFQDIWARRIALWAFVPMMFFYAASYFQRTAVPGTVFNDLQVDYGLTGTQIAGMGSAYICIYAICQLLVGICADKYGGMRVITYAGILFCIGALGFPLVCGSSTINLILMYFMRVLCGLGSSGMFLSLLRENDHLFGRKNFSVVLGIVYFIGYGGGLLGTMPFAMLKSHFHWNIILIAVGILSFIIYLIFLLGKRAVPVEPVKAAVPISFRPLLFVLKNPYTWCVAFNSAVCFCCYFVIQTVFGMKFLLDYAKLSEKAASGTIFSLTLISMSTLLAGGILTRLMNNRRKPLIIFSCGTTLFSSILMLVSILFHLPPFCFAAAYCLFAFASGMSIAFSMLVQELNSKDIQTQSAAFLNMSGYLAVAIFSVLIGLLLDSFVDPSEFTGGKAVIYPTKAYATLFGLLLIPTITSFVISLFLPETKGHYVREDYSKQIGRS